MWGHRYLTPYAAAAIFDLVCKVSYVCFGEVVFLGYISMCRANDLIRLMVASFAIALVYKRLSLFD